MADLTQSCEAMLRRHRPSLLRFAAASRLRADKLAFVIAHGTSKLGVAMKRSGIVVTERASVVIPITVDAVPALLAASEAGEVERLATEHGAVPVIVIDEDDVASVAWERVVPSAATPSRQNRSVIPPGGRDRG